MNDQALDFTDRCQQQLGYRFNDPALLNQALTHRSATGQSNERLEFLGDAVLSAIISQALFLRYPQASEGDLSRLRASLVKGTALAELARGLNLGDSLRLGGGELKSGGFRRESILADALEALFGAIYLDGGFERCQQVILNLYQARLAALPLGDDLKDPKSRLQEHLQSRQQPLPVYSVLEVSGAEHARQFKIQCQVDDQLRTVASGSSRRRAEQEAARRALTELQTRASLDIQADA